MEVVVGRVGQRALVALAGVLVMGVTACGGDDTGTAATTATSAATATAPPVDDELGNPLLDPASCPSPPPVAYVFAMADGSSGEQRVLTAVRGLAGRLRVAGLTEGCVRTNEDLVEVDLPEDNTVMDDPALVAGTVVVAVTPLAASCPGGTDQPVGGGTAQADDGTCYMLSGSGVPLDSAVASVASQRAGTTDDYVLRVTFASGSTGVEAEFERALADGGQIAFVRLGRVIVAPTPATSDLSQPLLVSSFSRDEARRLVDELEPLPALRVVQVQRIDG